VSDPLAFLITWTTYGTWLRGDERGWVQSGESEIQARDDQQQRHERQQMAASSVILNEEQRQIVESTTTAHCVIRHWELHALNVRTNHVHVVVSAPVDPDTVMRQLKAWCSRRLNEHRAASSVRKKVSKWWTEHGSTKWINDESYLRNAIRYVLKGQ